VYIVTRNGLAVPELPVKVILGEVATIILYAVLKWVVEVVELARQVKMCMVVGHVLTVVLVEMEKDLRYLDL
jgi:hypothetical protein